MVRVPVPRRLILAALLGAACSPAPEPLHVTPAEGSRAGGTPVRIEGATPNDDGNPIPLTGHGPVALYFGNRSALGVVIAGDHLIRAITPKREEAGPVDVVLLFDDGTRLTIEAGFSYAESPGVILQPDLAR